LAGCWWSFAREQEAAVIIRGLRAVSDFEFEFQMALMNRKLDPTVETVFLTPIEQFTYLSSRIIKEITMLGGAIEEFVPPCVAAALRGKSREGRCLERQAMKFHTKQIPPEGKHFEGEDPATILELNDPGTVPLTPVKYSLDVGLSEGGLFATGESGGRPAVPLCELPRAVCPAGAGGRFRLPDGSGRT
jgi:hypothetical protein